MKKYSDKKHLIIKTRENKILVFIIIILSIFFILQFPFLNADPDKNVDLHTRGAWTDEGLYTSQITNYINTGNFNIQENNQFLVSPLFNALIYPFYLLFGNEIIVSRIVVLCFWLLSLLIFFLKKELRVAGLIFLPIVLTQYQIFHFSHYSMPEMACIGWIILSFATITKYFYNKSKNVFFIILSSFLLFCAYSTKIQFLNTALILPATLFFYSFYEKKKGNFLVQFKPFLISLLSTLIFLLIYVIIWYLPHQDFYNYVWAYETEGRFPDSILSLLQIIKFHAGFTFWTSYLKYSIIFFGINLLVVPMFFVKKKEYRKHIGVILFVIFWVLAEFSKVSAAYLPYRYLLALIVSSLLLASLFISFFIEKIKFFQFFTLIAVSIIIIINTGFIYNSFNNRTYDIKAVNNYLKNYNLENEVLLGVWSHTLGRSTNAKCITVRRTYLNFDKPLEKYNPKIVIAEHNEADSDSAYLKQNIFLNKLADSVVKFDVWRYKIDIFWINQ